MKAASYLPPILLAVTSVAAWSQEREGFGSSYGPSLIGGSLSCDGCNEDSFAGAGGFLRLGRYLRTDLFASIEASVHTLPLAYTRQDTSLLSAALQWYPDHGSNFHVRGSLGVARLVEKDDEDDTSRRSALTAPALGISVGYDFNTRRSFLLTPFVSVTHVFSANYKVNGQRAGSASATAFQLGLGFSWY